MTDRPPSRLRDAILETAEDMYQAGIMSEETYRKITLRDLRQTPLPTAAPMTGDDIRDLRKRAHLSQAALARYLNLTVGYISQLERGTRQAKGPALALLNLIRHKGVEALL